MIASLVKNEVFKHFANKEFVKAERILRKLSLRLTDRNITEDYRLVLYNLAWVQDELGLHQEAKRSIRMIREIVERDTEFCKNNIENYIKLLGLYVYIFADTLTNEENIEINKRKYDICYDNSYYLPEALISKFNIYYIKNDIDSMVDCIESIHNYEITEENEDMKIRLTREKNKLLKILKEEYTFTYNELCEELGYMTDSSIAI